MAEAKSKEARAKGEDSLSALVDDCEATGMVPRAAIKFMRAVAEQLDDKKK